MQIVEIGIIVPIIIALDELFKRKIGINTRYIPVINIIMSIIIAIILLGNIRNGLITGLIAGLTACGLYDQTKILK